MAMRHPDSDADTTRNHCVKVPLELLDQAFLIGNSTSYRFKPESELKGFERPAHFTKADARRIKRTLDSALENLHPNADNLETINQTVSIYL